MEEEIKDAAQFSNFVQRVKMKYWQQVDNPYSNTPHNLVPEAQLDEILLLAWQEHKDLLSTLRTETEEMMDDLGSESKQYKILEEVLSLPSINTK